MYVFAFYENTISCILSEIGDGLTVDIFVIIGFPHEENYSKPYLLMCEELEKCDFQTIGKIIKKS